MAVSFIPNRDADFSEWMDNFVTYLTTYFADFGITQAEVTALGNADALWDTAYAAHVAAHTTAKSATAGKNEKRVSAEAMARSLAARINAYPGVTDEQKQAMRLVAPAPAGSGGDLGLQDETPLALIDISNRLKHVMKIQNKTADGVQKSKPVDALGAEVWVKVGTAPVDPSEMILLGVAAKGMYSVEYTGADAGKQAHYSLRWVTADGEKGNWSETESATIAA